MATRADNRQPTDWVKLCEEYEDSIRSLEAKLAEQTRRLKDAISAGALRECDIPACNCGGYHSRWYSKYLEMEEERDAAREKLDGEEAG